MHWQGWLHLTNFLWLIISVAADQSVTRDKNKLLLLCSQVVNILLRPGVIRKKKDMEVTRDLSAFRHPSTWASEYKAIMQIWSRSLYKPQWPVKHGRRPEASNAVTSNIITALVVVGPHIVSDNFLRLTLKWAFFF